MSWWPPRWRVRSAVSSRRVVGEVAAGAVGAEELDDARGGPCWQAMATYSGVSPSLLAWFTLAFAASSFATISVWPFWQATNSGVSPLLSAWFTSAPASIRIVTISVWPSWQAMYSGVAPSLSAWFTSAFAAISISTISVWPCSQAASSGVEPSSSAWFTSAPASRRDASARPSGARGQLARRPRATGQDRDDRTVGRDRVGAPRRSDHREGRGLRAAVDQRVSRLELVTTAAGLDHRPASRHLLALRVDQRSRRLSSTGAFSTRSASVARRRARRAHTSRRPSNCRMTSCARQPRVRCARQPRVRCAHQPRRALRAAVAAALHRVRRRPRAAGRARARHAPNCAPARDHPRVRRRGADRRSATHVSRAARSPQRLNAC